MIPPRFTTARVTSGMFSPSESLAPYLTSSLVSERPTTTTTTMDRLPMPDSFPAADRARYWVKSMSL